MALDWTSWIGVARYHLRAGRDAHESGFYMVAAQLAHQAAEESLKGLWILQSGEMAPRSHNLVELAMLLDSPEKILKDGRFLTPLYTTSRYPDAACGNPELLFDEDNGGEALEAADRIHDWCVASANELNANVDNGDAHGP